MQSPQNYGCGDTYYDAARTSEKAMKTYAYLR